MNHFQSITWVADMFDKQTIKAKEIKILNKQNGGIVCNDNIHARHVVKVAMDHSTVINSC